MLLIRSKTFSIKKFKVPSEEKKLDKYKMRKFLNIVFFTFLMLCYKDSAQGALITVDVSQQPVFLSALKINTWEKDGARVFLGEGNAKIEQGEIQITANSMAIWFTEVSVEQQIEGHIDLYCEGNVSLFQEGVVQKYEQMYLRLVTSAGVVADPIAIPIQNFEEEQKTELYLRGGKIRAERGKEFASKERPKISAPTSISSKGEPVDIFADDLDTWVEKDVRIVVAIGNVRIKRGNETLNADNIILYFDQEKDEDDETPRLVYKEVYAEGNVTLKREKDLIIAEKIFEDIKGEKGVFVNSVFRTSIPELETPIYISGDEIKHRGKEQYEIENGFFSTCSFGHPHFRFQSSNIRLFRTAEHSIVSAQKNIFYAGNVPLAYLPYFSFDMEKKSSSLLKDWEFGRTSRFGQFFKTDWDVYSIAFGEKMDDWSDMTFSADYLDKRGPAVGLGFEYEKPNYFGNMDTYYIRDEEEFDINGVVVEDKDRGHFLWRHRQFLPNGWRVDTEVSEVSDRSFFREYYYSEFKMEKDRETILYLRKVSDNRGITFLAEKQLRSYDTLVDSRRLNRTNETLPELKYKIIGEPLWNGRLNFTSETELAYHDRVFDWISSESAEEQFLGRGYLLTAERVFDRGPVRLEPEETIRFDTNNMLNAPFHFLGVRFNPYIGLRFSGYSESVDVDPVTLENDGNGTPRGRIVSSLGLNTSTTLSRTYNVYNNLLNINRIRHIMTPEIRFNFIPVITQDPEDLNQFDGIDALDTYKSITLGLRNRFQTKRGETGEETPVDFFDFDMEFNFYPGDAGLNRKRDDFIELDFRIKLTDRISLLSEHNEFNLRKGGVDLVNVGLAYSNLPKWSFYIGNRFIDDYSSTVVFSSLWSISEKWRITFFEQYDFKSRRRDEVGQGIFDESQNLFTRFVLTRFFHDWIGNITIDVDEVRADTVTRFDIIPRGVEKANKRFWLF